MANAILRFSLYSENDDFFELMTLHGINLPDKIGIKGSPYLLTNGTPSGGHEIDNSFSYKYSFSDITDIELCNSHFIKTWENSKVAIGGLHKVGVNATLDYEHTVFDNEYPSLYFQPEFLSSLGEMGILMTFYFYND